MKMMMKKVWLGLGIAAGFAIAISPVFAKNEMIQIKGSDTMVNLGQAWAEEFMRLHPDVIMAVTGGGSGTGIAAIISGTCDIAQSSREMKEAEKVKIESRGETVHETIVGYDGTAIVVHPDNPVSELTLKQLSDIFTGEITNWSAVGGVDLEILILSRERNSGTHVFFLEQVLRMGDSKGPEEFSTSALMMPSNQALVQEVKTSRAAIGYVGLGYVSEDQKIVRVAASAEGPYVIPNLETVQSGDYPISRPLYFYTRGKVSEDVRRYIDFVLGPEGQEIVGVLDFIPLKKK